MATNCERKEITTHNDLTSDPTTARVSSLAPREFHGNAPAASFSRDDPPTIPFRVVPVAGHRLELKTNATDDNLPPNSTTARVSSLDPREFHGNAPAASFSRDDPPTIPFRVVPVAGHHPEAVPRDPTMSSNDTVASFLNDTRQPGIEGRAVEGDLSAFRVDDHHLDQSRIHLASDIPTFQENPSLMKDASVQIQNQEKKDLAGKIDESASKCIGVQPQVLRCIDGVLGQKGMAGRAYNTIVGGTYAEITTESLQKITDEVKRVMKDNQIPLPVADDIILDGGSGTNRSLWILAQTFGCCGFGVEVDATRSYIAHSGYSALVGKVSNTDDEDALTKNVVFFTEDLGNMNRLPDRTWMAYLYDEAFEHDVMEHVIKIIQESNVRVVVTFKCKKHRSQGWQSDWDSAGFVAMSTVQVTMGGSRGKTTCIIYVRKSWTKLLSSDICMSATRYFLLDSPSKKRFRDIQFKQMEDMVQSKKRDRADEVKRIRKEKDAKEKARQLEIEKEKTERAEARKAAKARKAKSKR